MNKHITQHKTSEYIFTLTGWILYIIPLLWLGRAETFFSRRFYMAMRCLFPVFYPTLVILWDIRLD